MPKNIPHSAALKRRRLYLRAYVVLSVLAGVAGVLYFNFWGHTLRLSPSATDTLARPLPDTTAAADSSLPHPTTAYTPSPLAYDPYYFAHAFDFAWPAYAASDLVLEEKAFTICYDLQHGQPRWAAYRLRAEQLQDIAQSSRKFTSDPQLIQRGQHALTKLPAPYAWQPLVPTADMYGLGTEAFALAYRQRNATPQLINFSEGLWQQLEEKVRHWTQKYKEMYVVTGAVFAPYAPLPQHPQLPPLPTHFYKILLVLEQPTPQGLAFLLPHHAQLDRELWTYATHIAKAEEQTGLHFFPNMPAQLQQQLKPKWTPSFWK